VTAGRQGGKRPGAGRPKGAKSEFPRRHPDAEIAALAPKYVALGVDPASVDPRVVLSAIAVDVRAPALARVRACEALLRAAEGSKSDPIVGAGDRITRRAVEILAQGRPN